MCGYGLHLLPISVFILLPATFIISYIIAVSLGHVEAGFPYISDTGAMSPESCIFGQLLNICAVLVGLTIYVRYQQVKEHPSSRNDITLQRLNKVSVWLGLISALGISIVGNFQETNVIIVHLIGAIMAFGVGAIYAWIQTYMSHHLVPEPNTRFVFILRLIICVTVTITFFMMFIAATLSFKQRTTKGDPKKWKPSDGGYVWHVISTASEWLMACSVLVYFGTFIKEFQQLSFTAPKIHIHTSSPDQPRTTYSSIDPLIT